MKKKQTSAPNSTNLDSDRDSKGHFRKGHKLGFQKGYTPANKINDEISELNVSRQMKWYLRRKKNEQQTNP